MAGDFPGLVDVLGEVNASQAELLEATKPYFLSLYGQEPGTSLESARFKLFTKKRKSSKVMSLPPTSRNFLQHVLRAHLQVMLWKAADQHAPPSESANISLFGWEIKDDIPVPVVAKDDPVPPELSDVIRCQCKMQTNKCGSQSCSCHKTLLSCTSYCNCSGAEGCTNPYTKVCFRPDSPSEAKMSDEEDEASTDAEEEEGYDLEQNDFVELCESVGEW